MITILTAAAVSTDARYDGMDASDVSVTVADNGAPGITLSATTLTTSETPPSGATFTIVLNTFPLADVVIAVTSSDITEGTVSPASLTFTFANWSTPQTVTVAGVDDFVDDGDIVYTISTTATSASAGYNGLTGTPVTVTNLDDDTAGFTVTPATGLLTNELGGGATFTIVLNSEPTADVTIGLTSFDTTEVTVAPASLTFTPVNFNTPQPVTVTGVADGVLDGTQSFAIVTAPAISTDVVYNGLDPVDVGGANLNDGSGFNNGSFELGSFSGWVTQDLITPFSPLVVAPAGTFLPFNSIPSTPSDGGFSAITGFDGDGIIGPNPIRVAQDVFIPVGLTTLLFDYRAGWNNAGILDRIFEANIQPAGGGADLQTTLILTAMAGTTNPDTGVLGGTVDVSAFAGTTVRIAFEWTVPETFTGPAQFELDNIRLQ